MSQTGRVFVNDLIAFLAWYRVLESATTLGDRFQIRIESLIEVLRVELDLPIFIGLPFTPALVEAPEELTVCCGIFSG